MKNERKEGREIGENEELYKSMVKGLKVQSKGHSSITCSLTFTENKLKKLNR
jgi:hypothetical protein